MKKFIVLCLVLVFALSMMVGCGGSNEPAPAEEPVDDAAAAAAVDEMIAAIQVQERTDETDAQCEAAKAAWDALTDAQK